MMDFNQHQLCVLQCGENDHKILFCYDDSLFGRFETHSLSTHFFLLFSFLPVTFLRLYWTNQNHSRLNYKYNNTKCKRIRIACSSFICTRRVNDGFRTNAVVIFRFLFYSTKRERPVYGAQITTHLLRGIAKTNRR